jgi:hypothetical protein
MGRKLNGCAVILDARLARSPGTVGRVREVPVPGALAAQQVAAQGRRFR